MGKRLSGLLNAAFLLIPLVTLSPALASESYLYGEFVSKERYEKGVSKVLGLAMQSGGVDAASSYELFWPVGLITSRFFSREKKTFVDGYWTCTTLGTTTPDGEYAEAHMIFVGKNGQWIHSEGDEKTTAFCNTLFGGYLTKLRELDPFFEKENSIRPATTSDAIKELREREELEKLSEAEIHSMLKSGLHIAEEGNFGFSRGYQRAIKRHNVYRAQAKSTENDRLDLLARRKMRDGSAHHGPPPILSELQIAVESQIGKALKDPSSAIFTWDMPYKKYYKIHNMELHFGYAGCAAVNAKNSYGGYTGESLYYYFVGKELALSVSDSMYADLLCRTLY